MLRNLVTVTTLSIFAAACQGPSEDQPPPFVPAEAPRPAATQPAAQPLPDALERAVVAARQLEAGAEYFVRQAGGAHVADNPEKELQVRFAGGAITASGKDGSWSVGLQLLRWGRAGRLQDVEAASAEVTRNRVTYRRAGGMQEWFLNGPAGLEQGFTIARRPGDAAAGPLEVQLAVRGPLVARAGGDGRSVTFHDIRGKARATYRDLWVEDAAGRDLPATMTVSPGGAIIIKVQDAGARYPVTIDPMLLGVVNKVIAVDGSKNDQFGWAVDIDGDTAVVGSRVDDDKGTDSGSA